MALQIAWGGEEKEGRLKGLAAPATAEALILRLIVNLKIRLDRPEMNPGAPKGSLAGGLKHFLNRPRGEVHLGKHLFFFGWATFSQFFSGGQHFR